MKLLIDLLEDMQTTMAKEKALHVKAMGLTIKADDSYIPQWKSAIGQLSVDTKERRVYLFLTPNEGLNTQTLYSTLNARSNEEMMYELFISYAQESTRVDASVIGFGEADDDDAYLLFLKL